MRRANSQNASGYSNCQLPSASQFIGGTSWGHGGRLPLGVTFSVAGEPLAGPDIHSSRLHGSIEHNGYHQWSRWICACNDGFQFAP